MAKAKRGTAERHPPMCTGGWRGPGTDPASRMGESRACGT